MTAAVNAGRALTVAFLLALALVIGCASSAVAAPQLQITAPGEGAWSSSPLPLISGLSDDHEDPVTVSLYAGPSAEGSPAQTLQTLLAPFEGSWSLLPLLPLQDGRYTAVAEQVNAESGVGTSAPVSFTVDTAAPSVSIVSPGVLTKTPSPTLTGSAGEAEGDLPTVTVAIHEGASITGTVVAEQVVAVEGGSWSYVPAALKDGIYTASVSQEDEAGNTGEAVPVTFILDTTPPLVSIASPGAVVKQASPTLKGTAGTALGDLAKVLVVVHQGTSSSGTVVDEQLVIVSEGAWSYTTSALADGAYTAQVFQEDEAGNDGHGVPVTFTIDTTKPVVSVTSPSFEQVLHESQPTFSGGAGTATGDLQSITVKVFASKPGPSRELIETLSGLKPAGSTWTTGSSGPRLHSGHYIVVAEQLDVAGNLGVSEAVPFTIETQAPAVTLDVPGIARGEQTVVGPIPTFTGTRGTDPEDGATVKVNIYAGPSSTGTPLQSATAAVKGATWSAEAVAALPDGIYTAQAEQSGISESGFSAPVSFTVDADAPQPTITTPALGSTVAGSAVLVGGSAGAAPGDSPAVTLRLFSGSGANQTLEQEVPVSVSAGAWSRTLSGLAAGVYTVQALQADDVGNSALSAPVTFNLAEASVAPSVPVASFQWFPQSPRVGETVSLVSTSTDPTSAIVGFSWSLPEGGAQIPGGAVAQTSFSSAGRHVVRLTVTSGEGVAGTVDEAIVVAAPSTPLMQPFPIVRIAGSESRLGARLTLLTVQAPVGAKVSISCAGKGCPARLVSALASRSKGSSGTALITFRRFQRSLRAGVRLEIRVSRSGQIGKYTRFVIRNGKLPARSDSCLSPSGVNPIPCPST
jgi:large repetitive protein